jgi:hypothetical protein
MVILFQLGNDDKSLWYDRVDESDLTDAFDKVEVVLQNSHYHKEKSSQKGEL